MIRIRISENGTAFMQVFNKHAPVKSKRVKRETQPDWYNVDIKNATKNIDESHKSYAYHRTRKRHGIILWQVGIDRLVALVKNSNYLENSLITLGLIIRVKSYPQSMS